MAAAPLNYAHQPFPVHTPPIQVHAQEKRRKDRPYVPPPEPVVEEESTRVLGIEQRHKIRPIVPPPEPYDSGIPVNVENGGRPQLRSSRSARFLNSMFQASMIPKVKNKLSSASSSGNSSTVPPVPAMPASMHPPTSVQIQTALYSQYNKPAAQYGSATSQQQPSQATPPPLPTSSANKFPMQPSSYSSPHPQNGSPPLPAGFSARAHAQSLPYGFSRPNSESPPLAGQPSASPVHSPSYATPSAHSTPSPQSWSQPHFSPLVASPPFQPQPSYPVRTETAPPWNTISHPYAAHGRVQSLEGGQTAFSAPATPAQGQQRGEYHDRQCERKTLNGYFCQCEVRLRQRAWPQQSRMVAPR